MATSSCLKRLVKHDTPNPGIFVLSKSLKDLFNEREIAYSGIYTLMGSNGASHQESSMSD